MNRRRVLLLIAVFIAAFGTFVVYMYVRGADARAAAQYHAIRVLVAAKQIDPGETVAQAQTEGAFKVGTIGQGQQLPGGMTDLTPINGQIATTTIYPGEQIIASKFGTSAAAGGLNIPDGKLAISVNLTDPARVAGFVNPGDNVAIFMDQGTSGSAATSFTRVLLPKVEVIGVGTTSVVSTTTTDSTGAQTTEQLPRTLITLALTQSQAERVLYASQTGDLALGLLNSKSQVSMGPGVNSGNLFR